MVFVDLFGVEVYNFPSSSLPPGTNGSSKQKFAVAQQQGVMEKIQKDFEEGLIPRGDWRKGEIELLSLQTLIVNRFWHEAIWNVLFRSKDGKEGVQGTYRWIEWNVGVDSGAAVFAMNESNDVVLINNYRHASREWRIELPRGIIKQGETAENCAWRESLEEVGIHGGEVVNLGKIEPDSGLARMTPSIILMKNVKIDSSRVRRDVSESIAGHICVPLAEVKRMIIKGEIIDGYLISALGKLYAHDLI